MTATSLRLCCCCYDSGVALHGGIEQNACL